MPSNERLRRFLRDFGVDACASRAYIPAHGDAAGAFRWCRFDVSQIFSDTLRAFASGSRRAWTLVRFQKDRNALIGSGEKISRGHLTGVRDSLK
jgi:hypothetical protein